jgi:hypothetical protein
MPWIAKFIIGLEVLLFIAAVVIIIALIFRRIKIRKRENFEDRDN